MKKPDNTPDGAMYWHKGSKYSQPGWWKLDSNGWHFMHASGNTGWCQSCPPWPKQMQRIVHDDKPQWRGPEDGLPPVGTECEYPTGRGIVKLPPDIHGVVVVLEDGEYKKVAACACKPIRTEEEKAVEEMFALDCDPHEGMLSREDFCRKLYRENYRKQESQ